MLKIIKNTRFIIESKKIKTGISSNNVIDDGEVINQISSIKRKNYAKTTKSKIMIKSKNYNSPSNSRNMEARPGFLILEARLTFTKLRQAFIKALIFYYFDSKYHIRIKINISRYTIGRILS